MHTDIVVTVPWSRKQMVILMYVNDLTLLGGSLFQLVKSYRPFEEVYCPEMSVTVYQSANHNMSEDLKI